MAVTESIDALMCRLLSSSRTIRKSTFHREGNIFRTVEFSQKVRSLPRHPYQNPHDNDVVFRLVTIGQ